MSSSNCCFLTFIQVSQDAGFFQFIVIHTVKGIGIVNAADIDVFLELSCFFNDPVGIGNLISGSSAFSKTYLTSLVGCEIVLVKNALTYMQKKSEYSNEWNKERV